MATLTRREILEELKKMGIDSLYKLKIYCRDYENYVRSYGQSGSLKPLPFNYIKTPNKSGYIIE